MQPHSDFSDHPMPRAFRLGAFSFSILGPEIVDEDLAEVEAAADILKGLFDDPWPSGLDRAQNLTDLSWHYREFTLHRSFAWVIRNDAGRYLGCAYIFPAAGRSGVAACYLWIGAVPERASILGTVEPLFRDWVASALPPGYATEMHFR